MLGLLCLGGGASSSSPKDMSASKHGVPGESITLLSDIDAIETVMHAVFGKSGVLYLLNCMSDPEAQPHGLRQLSDKLTYSGQSPRDD